jgi:tetratricopeptide (TPR) repeat protein
LHTKVYLFYVNLRLNHSEDALKIIDESIKLIGTKPSTNRAIALRLKGKALVSQNSLTEAKSVADELKDILESPELSIGKLRYYNHLYGLIDAKKGNFNQAIDYFNRFYPNRSINTEGVPDGYYVMYLEPKAHAFYQNGDLDDALKEYKKITNLNFLRLACGGIYSRSFYMLGKIYQEKGDKTKAIENYEKFLDLWKDADPGLPEVEDAKERVASLTRN